MSALAAQSAAKGYPDVSVAWMHPDRVSVAERNKCAERGSSVCDEQFDEDSDGPMVVGDKEEEDWHRERVLCLRLAGYLSYKSAIA